MPIPRLPSLLILVPVGLSAVPAIAHPHDENAQEEAEASDPEPRERMLGESSILQPHRRNYLLPATRTGSPNRALE